MKVLARIALALLTLGLLILPAFNTGGGGSSTARDPVTITNLQAQYDLSATGQLSAVETITTNFPNSPDKHGIFRFFDTYIRDANKSRLSYKVTSVTLDGRQVPVDYIWENDRYYVAKIGDPNSYVTPGTHVYTISYTVSGATLPSGTGGTTFVTDVGAAPANPTSEFFWNVVAPGWRMSIDQSTSVINLPEPASQVMCSAGTAGGGQTDCSVTGVGTNQVTISTGQLPPMSGATAVIPLTSVPVSAKTLPWSNEFDPVFGTSVILVGFVLVLTIAGGVAGYLWVRSTREEQPGFPVMYAPPKDLGPVQTVYMDEESVGDHALLASILRAADLNLVKLFNDGGSTWTVQGITYPNFWDEVDPVTKSVGSSLGLINYGSVVTIDKSVSSGQLLKQAQAEAVAQTRAWARGNRLVSDAPVEAIGSWVWIAAIVLAGVGLWGVFGPTMFGLPFAAFVIGGVGLRAKGVGTRRTAAGRRLWSEVGGFKRMLSTPSSEQRFDFAARKDLFISYLPFAVAFGCADAWAEKYRTEMREEPPVPLWYPVGMYHGSLFGSGSGFDSFDQSLNSTIGAYESSQRSSSSGGGGFSSGFGGGGGGGGGGSW